MITFLGKDGKVGGVKYNEDVSEMERRLSSGWSRRRNSIDRSDF